MPGPAFRVKKAKVFPPGRRKWHGSDMFQGGIIRGHSPQGLSDQKKARMLFSHFKEDDYDHQPQSIGNICG
jgi:hypothetical protein